MRKVMMGTEAAALAAKLARVQVVAAYPITPQTVIVEELSDMIGRGELEAKFLTVESEHSAMASCIGASAAGARVFTATASHGLALMHEVLHYASGGRLPIVMVNANRSLSPPWNLYCDHTDSLSQRDTGWSQYYCMDVQDVLDSVVISYRVAEEALLPVMINMDAFYLTHTSEVLDVPEQPEVDEFLSRSRPARVLDVNHPVTFGNVCGSDIYASLKFSRHLDSLSTALLWDRVANEFAQRFGRFHPPVESYRTGDAELIIVSIGTAAGAVRLAVDKLREASMPAGGLRLSMVRPFPKTHFMEAIPRAKRIVVIDRDVSPGAEGIIAQEVKSALFGKRSEISVKGIIAGIGGRDVRPSDVVEIVSGELSDRNRTASDGESLWVEVMQ